MHVERNFGVKITLSQRSLNAQMFLCGSAAQLKRATCSAVESQLPATHEKKHDM